MTSIRCEHCGQMLFTTDESMAYKKRAEKAEALIKSLIAVGNIILNQDGKLDDDIKLAEAVWRVLVGQANE